MTDFPVVQIIVAALVVGVYVLTRIRKQRRRALLSAKIQAGAKIVDVRSSSEYAAGHYDAAINIPVDKLPSKLKGLGPRDTAIIVYCASGMRAANAQRILQDAGFTDVLNAGGISAMPLK